MLKRFVAPAVALLIVIAGLSFLTISHEALAKPSEPEQAYFIKHVPEASMIVVEPNYGEFYHTSPNIQGDSSGEILYISLDSLARSYDIKHTEMIRFERKGEMIPNLYVFVDTPTEEFQLAEAYSEPS